MEETKIDYQNPSKSDQIRYFGILAAVSAVIIISYFIGVPHYYLGWMSFAVAAYSVAGNDAIQTVGTFIESKKNINWVIKTGVFAGLLIIVHLYGWMTEDRQIHFHRLDSFQEVKEFNLLQLLSPIILVIITRLKAPVSTTFLILGLFGSSNVEKMLTKSFLGYGIAFFSALALWGILGYFQRNEYKEEYVPDAGQEKFWGFMQWISSMFLWVAWLLQDTANIAVFITRKMSIGEFAGAMLILTAALAMIIKSDGGTIQEVVSEKTDVSSAKAATLIDFIYAIVLFIFQYMSKLPMSTTWVFIGLLAGREFILHAVTKQDRPYLNTLRTIGKDVLLASLGISVSLFIIYLSAFLYSPSKTGWKELLPFQKLVKNSSSQKIQ